MTVVHSVGGVSRVETIAARYEDYINPTLATLLTGIQTDLNDGDAGDFTTAELLRHLNRAKLEIERRTRCYQETVTLSLTVALGHTYDITPLFEVFKATIDGDPIGIWQFRDVMPDHIADWDEDDAGTPEKIFPMSGVNWRFHPTPNATYAAVLRGYALSHALIADADVVTTLPMGSGIINLALRAQAYALLSRRSSPINVEMGREMLRASDALCGEDQASRENEFEF